jgi:heat shock protein HtpX
MWEQIRSNQMRSAFLIGILGALLVVVGYFLGEAFAQNGIAGLIIAMIIWAVMLLIAFFQGDSILLSVAGARKITPDNNPRLYNVVEEMKIASGLEKMPDVYIIDDPAMNAFATGRSKDKTAVTVTSGLLQNLNRDELQGVVAHEISHIKNRDVLLMSLAGVLLGTIVILAWYGTRIMFLGGMGNRRSSKSSGQGQAIVLVVALVLMILAPIAAQLLYFAVSRKREYLADASGALYTRYPEGLASALEKLAASTKQLKNANQATAPMYTINPFRKEGREATDLTSTHPPISERIRILRAMAGASPADYERAYEQVKHQKIIPQSALAASGTVALRAPSAEKEDFAADRITRTRETSDMLLRMNNYKIVTCANCGTKYKIPPDYPEPGIICAHCGRTVDIK